MNIYMVSNFLLWVVVLINLILTLVIIRHITGLRSLETLEKGTSAPDFQANSLENKIVTHKDFAGKSLVLVFVSPTCGHCRPVISEVEDLNASALNAGFEILFIFDGDINQTRAFVDEIKITMPIFSAARTETPFLEDFKIEVVPAYVIVDSENKVNSAGVHQDQGWQDFVSICKGKEG